MLVFVLVFVFVFVLVLGLDQRSTVKRLETRADLLGSVTGDPNQPVLLATRTHRNRDVGAVLSVTFSTQAVRLGCGLALA